MASNITGSTEDMGTVSVIASAEDLGMPAVLAELSGGSTVLEITLSYLGTALLASSASLMMARSTGVASMMTENSIVQ